MNNNWIKTDINSLLTIVLCGVGIFLFVLIYTRIAGKRSFSKLSSFDFAITVAIGSILASTILSSSVSLIDGAVGLGTLYILQMGTAILRRFKVVQTAVDNPPLLLMCGSEVLEENLKKGRVSKRELYSKLRESNVLQMSQIKAVVYEATGEISVLHSEDEALEVDEILLGNVNEN